MKRLKIATFNLWKNDGDFPKRVYELCDNLKPTHFDIACFQEDFSSKSFSSSKYINLELDYHHITTTTRSKIRENDLSASNLTIISKYKAELIEELFFQKGKEEERACQFVEVEIEDEKVLIVNTHLCHISSKSRLQQIETILKRIDKLNYKKSFLCGDLNALPIYKEIETIRDYGFSDKNKEFTHEDKVILDYIFHRSDTEIKVESKTILQNFSDHYCLVNKFNF